MPRAFCLVVALCIGACHTTAVRDDPSRMRTLTPDASPAPSAAAMRTDSGVPSEKPRARDVTALFPVVEGACPAARAYAVGTTPVMVVYRDAWAIDAESAHPFYRMGPPVFDRLSGTMRTSDHVGDVGGLDEAHAWIQLRLWAGRGDEASTVYVRAPEWKKLETPHGEYGHYALTGVLPQPDGSLWTYGVHSPYLDIPGDRPDDGTGKSHDKYFAFSPTGEPLKINLPGSDMVNAARLPNGELVSLAQTTLSVPIIRRWSPVKRVDDLVVANVVADFDTTLRVGTARAVLLASKRKHAFYSYTSEKLTPSALNDRVRDVASWLVTSNDDLMVTSSDGTLFIESKDGATAEEKLPEPGRLAAEPSAPWLVATSGALYVRAESGWRKITLPDGPWAAETHPPAKIEWVKVVGGETWVSAVRTDVGFGLRKASEVRVLYSSTARPAPLRCGSPFPATTWAPLPPRPSPSCTSLAVVVASEGEKDPKAAYPKIGAALRGDARFGESLVFVRFGKGPDRLIAILAGSMEIAQAIVKKLERVGTQAPEIVCGTPDEDRRLSFRVATGAFSPP